MEKKIKVGFALCGSFCTFDEVIAVVKELVGKGYDVTPIMSEYAYGTDTRFGKAQEFVQQLEMICDHAVMHTIVETEPVGPKKLFDVVVIAPCTGNTLGKLSHGVNDTCVTMCAKSHLRNQRPLVLAVSSNDALSNSARNIGALLNYKNVFFVPMRQDNPKEKPRSMVADFTRIPETLTHALRGEQVQPIY